MFRYAAYRLEVNGEVITQPVVDWMGEEPMDGSAFTYTIDVDVSRSNWDMIQLVSVTRDD